jgi:hypothetical protein
LNLIKTISTKVLASFGSLLTMKSNSPTDPRVRASFAQSVEDSHFDGNLRPAMNASITQLEQAGYSLNSMAMVNGLVTFRQITSGYVEQIQLDTSAWPGSMLITWSIPPTVVNGNYFSTGGIPDNLLIECLQPQLNLSESLEQAINWGLAFKAQQSRKAA